jgi:hypothetical protein
MTTTPEQIEAAPQKDVIRLLRNLKNAAYSHGVTDQTEYYSDKKYRVAQEKSEAAFAELRTAIASLQAEVARLNADCTNYLLVKAELQTEIMHKDAALEWINANWANQDMSHTDFRVKAYIEARGALAPASTEGGAS